MSLSIHGLGSVPVGPKRPETEGRPPASTASEQRAAHGGAASLQAAESGADTAPTDGVDPRVWKMLSTEERTFYLRHAISGPLTYGPQSTGGHSEPGRRLGGQLDVRA